MHVAIVSETFPPEINGVAMTVSRLCEGLAARGHRVQVVRPRQGQEEMAASGGNDYATVLVKGFTLPGYAELQLGMPSGRKLRRLWQADLPDAVYVATEGPLGWSAVKAARALKIPVASGFHTNFHQYSRHYGLGLLQRPVYAYLQKLHNLTDTTLVPTQELHEQLDGDLRNLAVLERGVDCTLFSPAGRCENLRRQWGVGAEGKVALYVGRLAPEKNLPLAVQAFAQMRRYDPGLRLLIVGDGPAYSDIYNPYGNIIFTGALRGEALASHYASADIFLFPSETETFGNVTLEAMASGLALVAFDYAAARRYVSHGVNGLLAPLGDHTAFCRHAVFLAENPDQVAALGRAARERVAGLDWSSISGRFESVLFGLRGKGEIAYESL